MFVFRFKHHFRSDFQDPEPGFPPTKPFRDLTGVTPDFAEILTETVKSIEDLTEVTTATTTRSSTSPENSFSLLRKSLSPI